MINKKIKNKKYAYLIISITTLSFNITFAVWANLWQASVDIKSLINNTQILLNTLMVVSFLYIIFNFVKRNDDVNKKNISYGLIALTVFFTLWGIIAFLKNTTFGSDNEVNLNKMPNVKITPY